MSNKLYRVELTRLARKDLKKLRHHLDKALDAINLLEADPFAGHRLEGTLRDCRSLEFNLKGSGAYRAVYFIREDKTICLVFLIHAHENVYVEAERRLKGARTQLDEL
jgi:mRNA-degrading endonuclease RelE of RelBE toxin-antitoxin system